MSVERKAGFAHFLRTYLVPAGVFQSICIGGGYATGRELVEYFTRYGPLGGLLGLLAATALLGLVLAATFEFARRFRAYDYRQFFRQLIGPLWPAFEVLYLIMAVIAVSVVAAATGKIMAEVCHIPEYLGVIGMMAFVGILNFYGREWIKRVLTTWSMFLYAVLIVYIAMVAWRFFPQIKSALDGGAILHGWLLSGSVYAWYSAAAVPAVLFALRDIATQREAVFSGFGSSLFFMVPAFLFHLSFLVAYPQVINFELPVYRILGLLGAPLLMIAYSVVLFGTLTETGAGIIQAVNERIDGALMEKRGRPATRRTHLLVSVAILTLCVLLSKFGIINLVAKGYGWLAWGFLLIYIIPLLSMGLLKPAAVPRSGHAD